MILELLLTPVLLVSPVVPDSQPDYKANARLEVFIIDNLDEQLVVPYRDVRTATMNQRLRDIDFVGAAIHTETYAIPEVWLRLAICESGMSHKPRWDYNGKSGFDGGIQFYPQTWTAFRIDGYPEHAWQATVQQQIAVGRLVAKEQGAGAWPTCTAKLRISTRELLQ
jgi:hypothetical protein